jgi:hypothetical protein
MMVMRTVVAAPEAEIEILLNVVRREIEVKFPLPLPSNAHQNAFETRTLKFCIPLDQIKQVYSETLFSHTHRFLIIPLDAPPKFTLLTDNIKSTHHHAENIWNEWQAWSRQTDLVEDRAWLETKPSRFRKEKSIIDIGNYHQKTKIYPHN